MTFDDTIARYRYATRIQHEYFKGLIFPPSLFNFMKLDPGQTANFPLVEGGSAEDYIHCNPTTFTDLEFSSVNVPVKPYKVSACIDTVGMTQTAYNLEEAIVTQLVESMNNISDYVILQALLTATIPAENIVAKDATGSDSVLTLEVLNEVAKLASQKKFNLNNTVFIARSEQIIGLLKETPATNIMYVNDKSLLTAKVPALYGMQFIGVPDFNVMKNIYGGIPKDAPAAGETAGYLVEMGVRSPVGVAINGMQDFFMTRDAGRNYSLIPFFVLQIGAGVIDPKKVIKVILKTEA